MKYIVSCSGWLTVEVEANSSDEAFDLVQNEAPGDAGLLYDLEVDSAIEASEWREP